MDVIDQAISADEIGLRSARHGNFVLRSAFQLAYRPAATTLHAAAAEGFLRIFLQGAPVPPHGWLAQRGADERRMAARLGMALHIANHAYIGIDDLDHVLAFRAAEDVLPVDEVLRLLDEAGMEAAQLVCLIRDPVSFDRRQLPGFVRAWQERGARIAIGSPGQPDLDLIRHATPDQVSIGGAWFRRVCESTSAVRLLCRFVSALQADGIGVVIDGIETRAQLAAALETGADLLRGFLFGAPQLAGTVPPETTHLRSKLLSTGAEIVPLFDVRSG